MIFGLPNKSSNGSLVSMNLLGPFIFVFNKKSFDAKTHRDELKSFSEPEIKQKKFLLREIKKKAKKKKTNSKRCNVKL